MGFLFDFIYVACELLNAVLCLAELFTRSDWSFHSSSSFRRTGIERHAEKRAKRWL